MIVDPTHNQVRRKTNDPNPLKPVPNPKTNPVLRETNSRSEKPSPDPYPMKVSSSSRSNENQFQSNEDHDDSKKSTYPKKTIDQFTVLKTFPILPSNVHGKRRLFFNFFSS